MESKISKITIEYENERTLVYVPKRTDKGEVSLDLFLVRLSAITKTPLTYCIGNLTVEMVRGFIYSEVSDLKE